MTTLQEQLRDLCEDSGEVEFRESYSGRSMYGATCVGIVGSAQDCMRVIGELIKQCKNNEGFDAEFSFEDAVDTLFAFKTDSMGRDVILYWEELEAIPFRDEGHDGQPDEAQEWHDFDPDC